MDALKGTSDSFETLLTGPTLTTAAATYGNGWARCTLCYLRSIYKHESKFAYVSKILLTPLISNSLYDLGGGTFEIFQCDQSKMQMFDGVKQQ